MAIDQEAREIVRAHSYRWTPAAKALVSGLDHYGTSPRWEDLTEQQQDDYRIVARSVVNAHFPCLVAV